MLHRFPLRRSRLLPSAVWTALAVLMMLAMTLFYVCFAPNWDIPLYTAVLTAVLLLPLLLLLRPMFGMRVLQVEHAGVVVSDYLFGYCLRRRVFQAVEMRHFDWEADMTEGGWTLRLLIQPHPAAHQTFLSVLHTENPYLLGAVWRDLELHYPGSALREPPPAVAEPRPHPSRLLGAILVGTATVLAVGAWERVSQPLYLAACGQVTPGIVQQVVWDSAEPGSTFHLRCLPQGETSARLGVSAYAQSSPIPQEGTPCEMLWAEHSSFYCRPDEIAPFLLPLPVLLFCLLLVICGVFCWVRRPS